MTQIAVAGFVIVYQACSRCSFYIFFGTSRHYTIQNWNLSKAAAGLLQHQRLSSHQGFPQAQRDQRQAREGWEGLQTSRGDSRIISKYQGHRVLFCALVFKQKVPTDKVTIISKITIKYSLFSPIYLQRKCVCSVLCICGSNHVWFGPHMVGQFMHKYGSDAHKNHFTLSCG